MQIAQYCFLSTILVRSLKLKVAIMVYLKYILRWFGRYVFQVQSSSKIRDLLSQLVLPKRIPAVQPEATEAHKGADVWQTEWREGVSVERRQWQKEERWGEYEWGETEECMRNEDSEEGERGMEGGRVRGQKQRGVGSREWERQQGIEERVERRTESTMRKETGDCPSVAIRGITLRLRGTILLQIQCWTPSTSLTMFHRHYWDIWKHGAKLLCFCYTGRNWSVAWTKSLNKITVPL